MELVNLRLGGGGGASSDDCTALASQVLTGVTAVTKDSNDEPIQGTMPSQNQMTFANDCWWNASSGLGARMSPAYAAASSGSNPYVYVPPTNVRNTLGITAANIRSGVSIAGVTGTLVDYGASRTVFNNGAFDGVYVTGMSQNWKTYRSSLLYNPVNNNIAYEQMSTFSTKKTLGQYINACFNYTINLTPFKSITVVCKNYGLVIWKGTSSPSSSTTYKIKGIATLILVDPTTKAKTTLTTTTAETDTGWSTSMSSGVEMSVSYTRTYTFNISSYTGEKGIVFGNGEELNYGNPRFQAGFRFDLVSFTLNA